jgi:hypothetical protein
LRVSKLDMLYDMSVSPLGFALFPPVFLNVEGYP